MTHFPVASELPVSWQKAKASNANDNCVECGILGAAIVVRDSKNPDGPAHRYPARVFADFVLAVGAGGLSSVND